MCACVCVCVRVCVQQMGVQDEWHRQTIMECLDELCKGSSSVVSYIHINTHMCI